jgi:CheY-like chemotaxis protein
LSNQLAITVVFLVGALTSAFVSYLLYRSALIEYRQTIESVFADLSRRTPTCSNYRMRALVVCRDAEIIRIFSQIFLEVGIETEKCGSESQAIDQLMSDKFEALVLDFDKLPDCPDVVRRVREIRPNKTAQVFAIVSNDEATTRALESGSTFVLKRPPVPFQVRNLLHTVYGRMLRSLQAYFRLNIEFTVSIARASGRLLQCTTINISQQGMAVTTPLALQPGEPLHVVFVAPNTDIIVGAEATVIWDDGHGKAGIRFECTSPPTHARFVEWLNGHFFMSFEGASSNPSSDGMSVGSRN